MDFIEFKNKFTKYLLDLNIELSEDKIEKFYKYMNLLIEWNEKINLTAIVEPNEIIVKHFVDSLTIEKYLQKGQSVIDVGTGAGFPGIPVSIVRDDCNVTLMDSLNKRINFLKEIEKECNISNVECIHSRAEELSQNKQFREKYDIVTSRAVASLNVLLEYLLPFVKVGGYAICMKGSNIEDEVSKSSKALEVLGGEIVEINTFNLADTDNGRNIIVVKKIKNTPAKYPRKAGTPAKEPIF